MPILQSVEDQSGAGGVLGNAPALARLPRLAGKLLPLDQAHELYARVRNSADGFVLENLLREMNVDLRQFIYGALLRSGVQPTSEIESFVSALVELIGPGPAAPA